MKFTCSLQAPQAKFWGFCITKHDFACDFFVPGSTFWGLRIGSLGIWGGMQQLPPTGRWEGTIELIIPVCCSVLDVSVTHLYHPRASQIPVTAQDLFFVNITPKVKFSRQVKFQFRISGQAVGEETRTRNFPSHALISIACSGWKWSVEVIYSCAERTLAVETTFRNLS